MKKATAIPLGALQKGFTLTELMVGLTVSLILVTIIAQVYVVARVTYRYQTEL